MASADGNAPSAGAAHRIPQTAPGRYELELNVPRSAAFATVRRGSREGGRVLARAAVAGRYAPEFDGIGTDRAALAGLAGGSGGGVVEPGDAGPIDLRRPRREVALAPVLASLGAGLIACGLILWRRGN